MYKGNLIYLRLFEPEDYEQTYRWHNDYTLMSSTSGPFRFVSREIERDWVREKSANNNTELYLAVCLIENDRMIGWYSISNIDYRNRSCFCSGVVIGDKDYRDSMAYEEATDLAFRYIIEEMNMNRISGSCLTDNILSRAVMEANYWALEGIERQVVYKGGRYHDVCHYAILREEYFRHLNNGDFDGRLLRLSKIIKRLRKEMKQEKAYDSAGAHNA